MQNEEMRKFNFSDIETIITDSSHFLKFAYKNKLPKSAKVFTTSPELNFKKNISVLDLKKKNSFRKNIELRESILDLFEKISLFLEKNEDYKILKGIAMRELLQLIPFYERCLLLNSLDFKKRILVLEHELYGTMYQKVFSNFKNVRIVVLNNKEVKIGDHSSDKKKSKYLQKQSKFKLLLDFYESFKNQWAISKSFAVFYIISKYFWKILHSQNYFKKYVIINDSSLIRETTFWLTISGYKFINERKIIENTYNALKTDSINKSLEKELNNLISVHFKIFFSKELNNVISSITSSKIAIHYDSMKIAIPKYIKLINNQKIKGVLSVVLKNVAQFAYYEAIKKKKIKLILFQHGISREISKHCDLIVPFLEGANSEIFITYNKKAKELYSNENSNCSKNYDVGVSQDYYPRLNKSNNKYPDILYNFTGIYCNQQIASRGILDLDIAELEISILKDIFKKIPHKVLFKTYPNYWNYPGIDPIIETARKIKNIEIYNKDIDSRFIMHDYKIIVTSRFTSTLGWSVMSGKPVVFLNTDQKYFCRNEVYELLKKSIIVFDKRDKNFIYKTKSFLKKSVEEIEEIYAKKRTSREEFVKKYISSYKSNAAKKISEILINI